MKRLIGNALVLFSSGGLIGGGLATIWTGDFWVGGFGLLLGGVATVGLWLLSQ